jgi:hypothetical protein
MTTPLGVAIPDPMLRPLQIVSPRLLHWRGLTHHLTRGVQRLDVSDHGVRDVGECMELFGGEQVDQVASNSTKVSGGSLGDGPKTRSSKNHNRAPGIVVGSVSLDQPALFHPSNLMGETALRPPHLLGQLGYTPCPVLCFDQVREHRVISHRQPGLFG